MNIQEIFLTLNEAAVQVHVLHLQTKSYAEHMALGSLYEALQEAVDGWTEALIGADGGKRPKLGGSIEISEYTPELMRQYIASIASELEKIADLPSDVLNMRDDLLAVVHKTQYLLTLDGEEEEAEEAGEQPESTEAQPESQPESTAEPETEPAAPPMEPPASE